MDFRQLWLLKSCLLQSSPGQDYKKEDGQQDHLSKGHIDCEDYLNREDPGNYHAANMRNYQPRVINYQPRVINVLAEP